MGAVRLDPWVMKVAHSMPDSSRPGLPPIDKFASRASIDYNQLRPVLSSRQFEGKIAGGLDETFPSPHGRSSPTRSKTAVPARRRLSHLYPQRNALAKRVQYWQLAPRLQ